MDKIIAPDGSEWGGAVEQEGVTEDPPAPTPESVALPKDFIDELVDFLAGEW